MTEEEIEDLETLRTQMREAAQKLEFERAAELRDRILAIERRQLGLKDKEAVN
jgi:excinuclease ABC subunit B